jgi:hypothetical protein
VTKYGSKTFLKPVNAIEEGKMQTSEAVVRIPELLAFLI